MIVGGRYLSREAEAGGREARLDLDLYELMLVDLVWIFGFGFVFGAFSIESATERYLSNFEIKI